jgi:arylsulfate sulfotransferase
MVAILFALLFFSANLNAMISVSLSSSGGSPMPLGTVVQWTANATDTGSGTLWYRFSAGETGEFVSKGRKEFSTAFHIIVDYGPNNSLSWTEMDHEGTYQVEVSVEDLSTGESASAVQTVVITSRIANGAPVINATANPLVFLYSAPACPGGGMMWVQFTSPSGVRQSTSAKPCQGQTSMNFYLGGMLAQTTYTVQPMLQNNSVITPGPIQTLTTSSVSIMLPNYTVFQPRATPTQAGVLLQCALYFPTTATDLAGNVIWYYDGDITFATSAAPGGYFLGLFEYQGTDQSHQIFREFDLAGNTIAETNAARVSQELAALGVRPINAFHHEARLLPNGNFLVLADNEQILTNVQGPGPVDVIGDEILILSPNLQVVWAWDAFNHLDTSRMAVLGETCPSGAGCAPYYLSPTANDWLHGNSLQLTPDGQILYSSRHQDWVFKISYDNGQGDGHVIWRLGKDGDFQYVSNDPYPWFSHQHDANYAQTQFGLSVLVYDDGNTRVTANPNENSRGQVLTLQETALIATLDVNADMGVYGYALGTAESLPGGTFHFDTGWITQDALAGANASRSIEVDASGNVLYGVAVNTPEYRTIRMQDLYTPASVDQP